MSGTSALTTPSARFLHFYSDNGSECNLWQAGHVIPDSPFTLVLSGGGLKGLAHIGVLRALEERGLVPNLVVGSSIGSLIAAAWAAGVPAQTMEARARMVRRRDVFQVARADVAFRRLLAPALYRREPLEALIASLVGNATFGDLKRRLLINTVDLHSGMQVMWG
ncbi:MAG: patatin-like phospholipase family protein, partial [Gemmatimonadales bacterium]|nr:patatin-like phospholipase family protein [Gemmatimonadales bacterium]